MPPGEADVLAQIYRACAQGLPVSGAAISVMPAAAVGGHGLGEQRRRRPDRGAAPDPG
ncbi:MAG: hypothetical protein ACRDQ4_01700 [Pseudonocardiaceae bacterium]